VVEDDSPLLQVVRPDDEAPVVVDTSVDKGEPDDFIVFCQVEGLGGEGARLYGSDRKPGG
jgi:hypothetical protein